MQTAEIIKLIVDYMVVRQKCCINITDAHPVLISKAMVSTLRTEMVEYLC